MSKPGSFTAAAIFGIAINCVACRISAEERAHTEAFLTRLSNRSDQASRPRSRPRSWSAIT